MPLNPKNWWEADIDLMGRKGQWDAVVQAFASMSGRGWLRAECPMCLAEGASHDKKKSLGLNTATGGYNCYKCGARGRLPEEYQEQLGELIDLELVERRLDDRDDGDEIQRGDPAPGFVRIFEGAGLLDPAHNDIRFYVTAPKTVFLHGQRCRGIPAERARQMQMGTGVGRCTGRVVTPVLDWRDPAGPWLAWHGRDATGANLIPHLYSKHLNRDQTVWNGAAIFEKTDEPLFIMEGILDAQAVWPHGVACLGKPLKAHLNLFKYTTRPIAVCLDGDAWQEGWAYAMSLKLYGLPAANIRLPAKTDPDEVPRDWLFAEARKVLGL